MIKLTRKQYEIEEPIQVADENGNLLVDYTIKITPEEKLQIRDIIFDEQDVKDGRLLSKLEREGKIEEYEELENKVLEKAKARQEEFEKIVFKEERENRRTENAPRLKYGRGAYRQKKLGDDLKWYQKNA